LSYGPGFLQPSTLRLYTIVPSLVATSTVAYSFFATASTTARTRSRWRGRCPSSSGPTSKTRLKRSQPYHLYSHQWPTVIKSTPPMSASQAGRGLCCHSPPTSSPGLHCSPCSPQPSKPSSVSSKYTLHNNFNMWHHHTSTLRSHCLQLLDRLHRLRDLRHAQQLNIDHQPTSQAPSSIRQYRNTGDAHFTRCDAMLHTTLNSPPTQITLFQSLVYPLV